jgi:hypothetical protein
MPKSAIPVAVACLLAGGLLGLLASPGQAESISRSCQTVNDWTICVRASGARSAVSLSCRTVDDRTVCSGPEGLRCEASAGRPVCRGGGGLDVEILPARRHTDRMTLPLELDLDED